MLGLDTNILIHAHRRGTAHHEQALSLLEALSQGAAPYALFWPSLYEFLLVVTHHRVFDPPSTTSEALEAIGDFLAPPVVRVLSETDRHRSVLESVLEASRVTGNLVHDAHIAALCLEHGVSDLLTGDRDFSRFPGLRIEHPF